MVENSDYSHNQFNQRIEEAKAILIDLSLPTAQQNDRSALTLLALLNLKPDTPWAVFGSLLIDTGS
jgi:hypothetical protein